MTGIPPTLPMIRKKAAILGASAWLQDNHGNAWGPKLGTFECQSAPLIEAPHLGIRQPTWSSFCCSFLIGTYTDITLIDYSYLRPEPMTSFSHRPETNTALQVDCNNIESQSRSQQDPLSMALAMRHEDLTLIQPMASTSRCSKDAPTPTTAPELQETSTYVYVAEQTDMCIWDAFRVLKRLLLESMEPTTSDLLCISHLEDRLKHLSPHK